MSDDACDDSLVPKIVPLIHIHDDADDCGGNDDYVHILVARGMIAWMNWIVYDCNCGFVYDCDGDDEDDILVFLSFDQYYHAEQLGWNDSHQWKVVLNTWDSNNDILHAEIVCHFQTSNNDY